MSEHHEIARLRRKLEALAADHATLLKSYTALVANMTKANLIARVAELEAKLGRTSA